jgi:hypothetical protein
VLSSVVSSSREGPISGGRSMWTNGEDRPVEGQWGRWALGHLHAAVDGKPKHSTPTKQSARRLSSLSLEPRRFLRAASNVASAVRMRPGPGKVAAGHDQVFLANGTALEPALQNLADPGRVARLG